MFDLNSEVNLCEKENQANCFIHESKIKISTQTKKFTLLFCMVPLRTCSNCRS